MKNRILSFIFLLLFVAVSSVILLGENGEISVKKSKALIAILFGVVFMILSGYFFQRGEITYRKRNKLFALTKQEHPYRFYLVVLVPLFLSIYLLVKGVIQY